MGNHSRKQKVNTNSCRSKRSPGYRPPISVHLIAALPRAPSWHNRNLRKLPTGFLLHNQSQQADARKLNQPAIVLELACSSEPVSIPEQYQPLGLIDVELICSSENSNKLGAEPNQPALAMELACSSEPISIPEQYQPLFEVELTCSSENSNKHLAEPNQPTMVAEVAHSAGLSGRPIYK